MPRAVLHGRVRGKRSARRPGRADRDRAVGQRKSAQQHGAEKSDPQERARTEEMCDH